MIDRGWLRAAGLALARVALFAALFVAVQFVLVLLMSALWRGSAVTIDSLTILAAAVIAGLTLLRAVDHAPASTLGFALDRKAGPQFGVGFAIGALGLLVASLGLIAVGSLRYETDAGSLGQWIAGMIGMLGVLLIPAASEEALFRGYPFQKLVAGFGSVAATLVVSALFAFAHAHNPSANGFALLNIFVAGVVLSVAYLRTRSLWFASGVHLGWNWCMAALLDLPVSGLELFDAPLYEPVARGPAWLDGGAFGPEAGIVGLLGLLLVLAGVVWMTRNPKWLT